jgi:hypothetical protein
MLTTLNVGNTAKFILNWNQIEHNMIQVAMMAYYQNYQSRSIHAKT